MIGIVLAGGASSRFGGTPKGLIAFDGRPMAERVANLLKAICTDVFIETAPDAGYEALNLPIISAAPEHAGKGPLAGMAVGLAHAQTRAAFAPCDMPLLTPDIYERLRTQAGRGGAYAQTSAGVEPLVAILHARARSTLLEALVGPRIPRTHAALDAAEASPVTFADAQPFANVNTPADLDRLSALAR